MLVIPANTRHDLYLFSAKGQATRVHAHQIPEAPGAHYADISGLTRRDRIVAMLSFSREESDALASSFLLLATSQGKVKRAALTDLFDAASTDPAVIGLDDGDELCWAGVSAGEGESCWPRRPGRRSASPKRMSGRWACRPAASAGSSWPPKIAWSAQAGSASRQVNEQATWRL